jgi:AbrB family looped-hinge helix DNA binding protein
MKTLFEVRVRRNGQITLPKELRDRASIKTGTTLTLHDLGNGVLLLSALSSRVSEIADRLAQQWRESGVSLEDMLAELRQVRKERDARDT